MTVPATLRPQARAADSTRGHLYQVDIVRLCTFLAVMAVHSIAFTQTNENQVAGGLLMLLQFGRELFFALTGFVLVHAARKQVTPVAFWRRRFTFVLVPYVAWSAIYLGYAQSRPGTPPLGWHALWWDLLTGGAQYHLYFLLVSLQLYAVFPLLLRVLRASARHALLVLAVVGAANLGWLAVLQFGQIPAHGAGRTFWIHAYELLPTYTIWVLLGGYAALRLADLQQFVDRRARVIVGGALMAIAGALAVYGSELGHRPPRQAAAVLQPGTALSCLAAIGLLYLAGSRWAAGPRHGDRFVTTASDVSFGVYLAHPLVLAALLDYAGFSSVHPALPMPVATVLGVLIPATGAFALSWCARRTPLSLALTGRPGPPLRVRRRRSGSTAGRVLLAARASPSRGSGSG